MYLSEGVRQKHITLLAVDVLTSSDARTRIPNEDQLRRRSSHTANQLLLPPSEADSKKSATRKIVASSNCFPRI